jgi:hypothetical protein
MLKEAFGDEAMRKTQTHEWYKCFKEGWYLRTMNFQDDLQHKKMKKTSKKFRKWFVPIVV